MAALNKYNKFLLAQMGGTSRTAVDFDTDVIKVVLVTSAYTPSAAAHQTFADVTASQVAPADGGKTLTGLTLAEVAGVVTFDADDVTWLQDAGGFTNARYAVIYREDATNGSTLIGYIDLTSDKGNVSGDFILQFNANGVINWS